ncbi:MAG: large conductance mechanosensitive channel protein MscL [Patulibacter sp.]
MLKGFRDFLLRGNLVELAVAFVIGGVFAKVVSSLVEALINPLIALLVGKPDFSDVSFTISGTVFPIGVFIGALLTFVATAAAVYFFVVVPYSKTLASFVKDNDEAAALTKDQELLTEIRDALAKRG